jgi:sporulation protein YlmC with PRC-barrel domain
MGVGEHAVTTESENMLTNINETANANSLLERNIEVKGNRVLTNKGNLIGIINEYEVEEETGKIKKLHYKTAQDETRVEFIDAEQVLTYGADVVVIKEKPDNKTDDPPTDETPATEMDGASYFKQKQKEFLMGKKVVQDIKDASGQVIVAEGTVVDEDIIKLAESNGRFVELSQCVK